MLEISKTETLTLLSTNLCFTYCVCISEQKLEAYIPTGKHPEAGVQIPSSWHGNVSSVGVPTYPKAQASALTVILYSSVSNIGVPNTKPGWLGIPQSKPKRSLTLHVNWAWLYKYKQKKFFFTTENSCSLKKAFS